MFLSKRKRIIKKSVKNTVAAFAEKNPKIYNYFFYGEFDITPQNLVIWYLFETDDELESAKKSGLCFELKKETINNLISLGYPKEAFDITEIDFSAFYSDKITFQNDTQEDTQRVFDSLANKKVTVSFATQEDIDKKANGDYHLYFQ